MILTCKEMVERVTDARDGRLSTFDRICFRVHLGYCRNCCRYVAQMDQTIAALRHVSEGERAPPDVVATLLERTRRPR